MAAFPNPPRLVIDILITINAHSLIASTIPIVPLCANRDPDAGKSPRNGERAYGFDQHCEAARQTLYHILTTTCTNPQGNASSLTSVFN